MRYPLPRRGKDGKYKTGISQRLGNLFDFLGMQNKLIPYYFSSDPKHDQPFKLFNNVRIRANVHSDLNASALGIDEDVIRVGVKKIFDDVITPFARRLLKDSRQNRAEGEGKGWKTMMRNDVYSTRAYMSLKYIPSTELDLEPEHLPTHAVNWIETMHGGTGSFDQAFSETVLGAISFGNVPGEENVCKCIEYECRCIEQKKPIEWKCIE